MLQALRQISKFSVLIILLTGCGVHPVKQSEETSEVYGKAQASHKIFNFSYEQVWRAAQLTLKYPIAVNNIDNGMLETEWIRSVDGFVPPVSTKEPSAGSKYKITINMVKGKLDAKPSVRVSITKKIESQKDFFSEVENQQSDGLEEKVIFYRIEREILIDEGLKKAALKN